MFTHKVEGQLSVIQAPPWLHAEIKVYRNKGRVVPQEEVASFNNVYA